MIEGVVVVDAAGRLQLANGAARDMLALNPRAGHRAPLSGNRQPSGCRVADWFGARRPRRRGRGDHPEPRSGSNVRRARRAGRAHERAGEAGRGARVSTTSPISSEPTASAGISSQTCRTSCARRSRPSGATSRRCSTRRRATGRSEGFSTSSSATRGEWSGSCGTCCGSRALTRGRRRSTSPNAQVAPLFDDVQADLAPVIERRGHRVTTRDRAGRRNGPRRPAKLHDVIRNLVENAVHHTPDGTTIQLSASRTAT